MLPGCQSPMHRTNSIDYGIVLDNEIELELEDGAKRTISAGGIIVQRGTNHLWRNTHGQAHAHRVRADRGAAYRHDGLPLPEVMG